MKDYLSLIKFSHTIFALPFALVGFFLAVELPDHAFELRVLMLVLFCMVFARSAAMAFNRYIDRDIDGANPRTVAREIPAGILSPRAVLAFVILCSAAFIATTYLINDLCFVLSPIALLVILGYSYTKRFTALCHLVLGLGLSLAPIGAYLAVTGQFALLPLLYGLAVMLWVAGFDIIYALQDEDLDRSLDLRSTPVWLGRKRSLWVSRLLHLFVAVILAIASYYVTIIHVDAGVIHLLGLGMFVGLLAYQHSIVSPSDLSRVGLAFFTTNGVASVVYGCCLIVDLLT